VIYLENIAHVEELVINCIFEVVIDILSITHSSNEILILLDNNFIIKKLSSRIQECSIKSIDDVEKKEICSEDRIEEISCRRFVDN